MPPEKKQGTSGKWSAYQSKPAATHIEWSELDASLVGQLVQAVTQDGDAVLLGATRDGGALVITICAGDQRIKFYCTTLEQAESQLIELIAQAQS
jgi:hypothetical protein